MKTIANWHFKPRSPPSWNLCFQFNNNAQCTCMQINCIQNILFFVWVSLFKYGNIWNRSILMATGTQNHFEQFQYLYKYIWPTDDNKVDGGNSAIVIIKDLIRSMNEIIFFFSTEKYGITLIGCWFSRNILVGLVR